MTRLRLVSRSTTLIIGLLIATLLFAGGLRLIRSLIEQDDERLSFELYRVSVELVNRISNYQEPEARPELLGFVFLGGRGEVLASGGIGTGNPVIQRPNSHWFEGGTLVYHRQVSGGGPGSLARADAGAGRQLILWYNPGTILSEQRRRNLGLYGGLTLLSGMVLAFTLISRRLLLVERQLSHQERLALLGQASRTISHEIQSPLAALDLHRQLAEKKLSGKRWMENDQGGNNIPATTENGAKIDDEVLGHLRVMAVEAGRIRAVIRDVRKLIHPEQGKPETLDLERFTSELIKRFPLPEGQSITLDPVEGPILVHIDPSHLASILENLLSNSVQSQLQKGVSLPIAMAISSDRTRVRLAVHDSGIGLDRYQRAHAFEPFFSGKPEGSGLGLSLARTLARYAGGEVELQSHGVQGCSAILILPVGGPL